MIGRVGRAAGGVAALSLLLFLLTSAGCGGGGTDPAGGSAASAPPPGPEYRAALERADRALGAGDLQAALRASTEALLAAPALGEPYQRVSDLYAQMGRHENAAEFFMMAAGRFPESAEAPFFRGVHLYRLARWDEALEAFDRAVALEPGMAAAHFQRGVVLQAKADFDGAIAALGRAAELNPGDPYTAVRLARMLRVAGRYDEAREVVEQARTRSDRVAAVHYALGQILLRVGTATEAEASFRRALELDPGYREARHDLGRLQARMGRDEEARRELVLARHIKRVQEERSQLTRLVGLSEDDPGPALALAAIEINQDRLGDARRWIARAEALGAAPDRVSGMRALIAYLAGDVAAGDAELGGEPGFVEQPVSCDRFDALRDIALRPARLHAQGLGDEAAIRLAEAHACANIRAGALRSAAALYRRLGRDADAVAMLERAEEEPSLLDRFAAGTPSSDE